MKDVGAVIGGEGSGGVIYAAVHYGRGALVGTAILLQHLAESDGNITQLTNSLPQYYLVYRKIDIGKSRPDKILNRFNDKYKNEKINLEDGVRIDFIDHWVHLRKSNTEPVIRCIVEAKDKNKVDFLVEKYLSEIKNFSSD